MRFILGKKIFGQHLNALTRHPSIVKLELQKCAIITYLHKKEMWLGIAMALVPVIVAACKIRQKRLRALEDAGMEKAYFHTPAPLFGRRFVD